MDTFYDQLTDQKTAKQAQNRAASASSRAPRPAGAAAPVRGSGAPRAAPPPRVGDPSSCVGEHEELLKEQADVEVSNPFERVVGLIGGASDSADASCDLSIFRSVLVRLKNDPKRHAGSEDLTPSD